VDSVTYKIFRRFVPVVQHDPLKSQAVERICLLSKFIPTPSNYKSHGCLGGKSTTLWCGLVPFSDGRGLPDTLRAKSLKWSAFQDFSFGEEGVKFTKFQAIKFLFYWNEISPLGWNRQVSICTALTLSAKKKWNFLLKSALFSGIIRVLFGKLTKKNVLSHSDPSVDYFLLINQNRKTL
jgi:hypothetical protein